MKKKIILIAMITMLLAFTFIGTSFAIDDVPIESLNVDDILKEQETSAEDDETVYDDLYIMENKDYVMNTLVDGNAFIMVNGNVKITGKIAGSAYILANGKIEIAEDAIVLDSLYALSKETVIKGYVCDVYSASETFETASDSYIERNLKAAASNLKLRGIIGKNANLTGENITVKDEESALEIGGDFSYTSKSEIENLDEIVKNGEINYTKEEEEVVKAPSFVEKLKSTAIDALASAVYVIIVYFIIKLITPKFIERVGKDIKEKSIVDFAVGLLSFIVGAIAIVLSFILLITLVGIPVSIISWILMLLAVFISPAVFNIAVLELLSQKFNNIKGNTGYTILALIGISLCLSILELIPYIGSIVNFIIITMGLGLVVRNIVSRKNNADVE